MSQVPNNPPFVEGAEIPAAAIAPLSYVSPDTDTPGQFRTTGWLIAFAVILLLVGGPGVLFSLFMLARSIPRAIFFSLNNVMPIILFMIAAPMMLAGICLLAPSPRRWRYAYVSLTSVASLQIIATVGAVVLEVSNKNARGWDSIAIAIGVVFEVAAGLLFCMNLIPAMYLTGARAGRVFGRASIPAVTAKHVTWFLGALWLLIILAGLLVYFVK